MDDFKIGNIVYDTYNKVFAIVCGVAPNWQHSESTICWVRKEKYKIDEIAIPVYGLSKQLMVSVNPDTPENRLQIQLKYG
jgi:hypothetical protein